MMLSSGLMNKVNYQQRVHVQFESDLYEKAKDSNATIQKVKQEIREWVKKG